MSDETGTQPVLVTPLTERQRDLLTAAQHAEAAFWKLRQEVAQAMGSDEGRRAVAVAATNMETGFMWLKRAIVPGAFALLLAMLLSLGLPAAAHRAPSGWAYDHDCCHNLDCAPVADAAVREVQGGYQVTIAPGTHPMVPAGAQPVTGFVPHGDPRIRPSGDEHRHACVSASGRVLCVYVRPGGV